MPCDSLEGDGVRILPLSVPASIRHHYGAPDDLVCAYYGERSIDPNKMDDIGVHEPLRSWMSAHV